jgi:hypothetical protein
MASSPFDFTQGGEVLEPRLSAAKQIGTAIPYELLARANQVIK